jgi:hypothetical protein
MALEPALVVEATDGRVPTAVEADELEKKREKKREKVRSAWISFVGRTVRSSWATVARDEPIY